MKIKRKLLVFLTTFMLFIGLTGCDYAEVEQSLETTTFKSSMFVQVEQADAWRIVYHKETKVMYAVSDGYNNKGTFTLLVNKNGKPMLYKEEE